MFNKYLYWKSYFFVNTIIITYAYTNYEVHYKYIILYCIIFSRSDAKVISDTFVVIMLSIWYFLP